MPTGTTVLGKTEARLFTPPLPHHCDEWGELLEEFTDGPSAIKFAEDILGITLFPWQRWLLNHALEITDGGLYRFRIILVMVARQNGKTTVENILALWHMYALRTGLVIGTAQNLDRSEEAWKDCLALAEMHDDLNDMIEERNFGHPKYFNLDNGCEYRVAAASRRGGRGFSGDLILLDELREHQSWDSWSSVTNTMNARPLAQAWAFSNAGDALSVVIRYQRALAHRELGWPDGDDDAELLGADSDVFDGIPDDLLPEGWDEVTTGFFEWSAPPMAKRHDIEALSWANPSLNHQEIVFNCPTTRTLLSQLRTTPPLEYDMEVLCRFVPSETGGPFLEGSWEATYATMDDHEPDEDAEVVVCVEVSSRRDATYISRVTYRTDDKGKRIVLAGISHDQPGTDWVAAELIDSRKSYSAVIIRDEPGSPSLNLAEDLRDMDIGDYLDNKYEDGWPEDVDDESLPIVSWSGSDVQAAHGDIFDMLRDKGIRHLPHRSLDIAATSAEVAMVPGGGFRADIRRSPSDTAALYAIIGGVWGIDHIEDNVSMYETEQVLVIPRRGF